MITIALGEADGTTIMQEINEIEDLKHLARAQLQLTVTASWVRWVATPFRVTLETGFKKREVIQVSEEDTSVAVDNAILGQAFGEI